MNRKYDTRESWLNAAVDELRPLFRERVEVPRVRVSIGFPPKRGLGKRRVLGVCCMSAMATDGIAQIYINPTVSQVEGAEGVLSILVHEMIHACGIAGHGKDFRELGVFVGLEGQMSSSTANESLQQYFEHLVSKLGAFPHASLHNSMPNIKPDRCRLVKCVCEKCGYTIRITNKWIAKGIPECPICKREFIRDL